MTLIQRLTTEADQCRNDGANDIANLLDEAVASLSASQAPAAPKVLDDPRLQELFTSCIDGALTSGYQGASPPPEGHWLAFWWKKGQAVAMVEEGARRATQQPRGGPADEARARREFNEWRANRMLAGEPITEYLDAWEAWFERSNRAAMASTKTAEGQL